MERPQRRVRRIVLWATLGLVLLPCIACSGITLYATLALERPVIFSVGSIQFTVHRSLLLRPDAVYTVLTNPLVLGFGWPCRVVHFNNSQVEIGDFVIGSSNCVK